MRSLFVISALALSACAQSPQANSSSSLSSEDASQAGLAKTADAPLTTSGFFHGECRFSGGPSCTVFLAEISNAGVKDMMHHMEGIKGDVESNRAHYVAMAQDAANFNHQPVTFWILPADQARSLAAESDLYTLEKFQGWFASNLKLKMRGTSFTINPNAG